MSVGNLKDQGNKGSNFPYQRAVLELLSNISTGGSTGGCCPTAATEFTLLQILSALQGGAGIFNNLVIDTTGPGCPSNCPTYSEVRIYDPLTSTFTTKYYNANGVEVFPAGPLVYVNPQFVLNDIYLQLIGVTRTPGMTRVSSAVPVTIPANTVRSVSFRNAGSINATVLGATLLPGETVNFDAGSLKDTLGAITYNANGTDLLIITTA